MKVLVDIPSNLVKYFEYIPEDALSQVIVKMIQDALEEKLNQGTSTNTAQNVNVESGLMNSLLSQLQNMMTTPNSVQAVVPNTVTVPEVQPVEEKVPERVVIDIDDDDDDLGDLADLLK